MSRFAAALAAVRGMVTACPIGACLVCTGIFIMMASRSRFEFLVGWFVVLFGLLSGDRVVAREAAVLEYSGDEP